MDDMKATIEPKSDQLNADDLITGPITIKVKSVAIKPGEQPVSIFYDGDNGKPYKCCKSMARIMVAAWGADSKKYVGRSMTLYRDPEVKWAGMAVGGIRISHMSDLDDEMTMALTVTRSNRKPFTVQPLVAGKSAPKPETTAGTKGATITEAQESILLDLLAAAGLEISAALKHPEFKDDFTGGKLLGLRATRYDALVERLKAKAK